MLSPCSVDTPSRSLSGINILLRSIAIISIMLYPDAAGAAPQEPIATQLERPSAQPPQLWYGVLDAKSQMFRFLVTTRETDSGWEGKLLSLDEGMREFELTDIQVNEAHLQFKLPAAQASYRGTLSQESGAVSGQWTQRGREYTLDFQPVTELPQEKLRAYWKGRLDAIVQKLDVAFRELEDGTVLFDSLTQKVGGFVAEKTVDGNKITIEVPAIAAKFSGEVDEAGTTITGKWKQGLLPLSLTLERSDPATLKYVPPARPQTPHPPFPYDIEEVAVKNPQAAGVTLAGSLTLPQGHGPFPAIILISGSGPQDRDETIVDHKPFWVIADYLTRQGLAVLRFDDRGVGRSTGNFATATSFDFASDVTALVAFLRQHAKIDASRIALCGHSEGGLIAPMVAAADPEIAALVLLAGTGVNGEAILLSQARLIMQASGVPEAQISSQAEMQQVMIELARREPPLNKDAFVAAARTALKKSLSEQQLSSKQTDQMIEQAAEQLNSPWFRTFLSYEPAEALAKIRCPTLVLNGELDLQVDPKLNIPAIEAAFQQSGFTNYSVQVLPKLNHLFQTAITGNVTEYADIEETISPVALQAIGKWFTKTLLGGDE
jgi:uncharacterized protein